MNSLEIKYILDLIKEHNLFYPHKKKDEESLTGYIYSLKRFLRLRLENK
jgi:hypothetical protein